MAQHSWSMFSRDATYGNDVALPIVSAQGVRKHLNVATAVITCPFTPDRWESLAPGQGLSIYRDGLQEFTGPVAARQLNWDADGGRALIHIEALGDLQGLADRLAMPDPLRAADDQTVNDYWLNSSIASTAMWQLISDQAGPTCRADRRIPGLAMGANPGVGISRAWSALFNSGGPQGVLDVLADISVASGADLGVRMRAAAGALTADVVAPRDLTGTVKFSADLRNLVALFYREAAPTATHALSAGQGDLHARLRHLEVTTDPLATAWGRQVWSYIDRRDTADVAELTKASLDALDQGAPTVSLTVTLTDSQAATYRTDWDLGDKVTVYVGLPGQTKVATVTDVVREIAFSVDDTGKELLQTAVGSYDAKAKIPTPTQRQLAVAGAALAGLISRK